MTPLFKQVSAEFVGTGTLVASIVGSGEMAAQLSGDSAVRLVVVTIATVLTLATMIHLLAPVSGSHFNPIVTLLDLFHRQKHPFEIITYIGAQITGGISGAAVANFMFGHAVVTTSAIHRSGGRILFSEAVATAGLIFIIHMLINQDRTRHISVAVAAWIGAAYFFTSSTSFANPAVTISRIFTDASVGISSTSALGFVLAQFIGGVLGALFAKWFASPALSKPIGADRWGE